MQTSPIDIYKQQYELLNQKLQQHLPMQMRPTQPLVKLFRQQWKINIDLSDVLTIGKTFNSGDITGILCHVNYNKKDLACPLTYLQPQANHPLFREILEYQRKRSKRIKKLNQM